MHRGLSVLVVVAVAAAVAVAQNPGCVDVTPDPTFVNQLYEGRWYEIGRIQTPGGAFWQRNCYCDATDFHSEEAALGDGEVTYSCRKNGTDGDLTAATADLLYDGAPGKFQQRFRYPFAEKLDYRVIYIDENVVMEYDCDAGEIVTNYCVHFMARTPHMDEATLTALIDYAERLGLNNQNVAYKATRQDGCW